MPPCCSTGSCVWSVPYTRPNEPPASTRPASRRTVWWAVNWNVTGRRRLKQQRQLEEEFRRWQQSAVARLTAADQEAIRTLASDLPAVWQADTTAPADRKRIARLLLERVTVMVDKDSDKVDVRLHWAGGITSTHQLTRPVSRYDQQTNYPRLVQRLREMCTATQCVGDSGTAERGGVPAAEANAAVHGSDGTAAEVAIGPAPTPTAWQPGGPGAARIPADGAGASAGCVA